LKIRVSVVQIRLRAPFFLKKYSKLQDVVAAKAL